MLEKKISFYLKVDMWDFLLSYSPTISLGIIPKKSTDKIPNNAYQNVHKQTVSNR